MVTFMIGLIKRLAVIVFLIQCVEVSAQEKRSSYFISGDFFQIKEEENLGIVFKGPQLTFGLIYEIPIHNNLLVYRNRIGLGVSFSRGMIAAQFNFKPVDLFYGFDFSSNETKLFVGPTLKLEYNVQLFPHLKGGQPYWFTNGHLGVGSSVECSFDNHLVKIFFSSSLIGIISRPQPERDPYWMNFYFSDIIAQAHEDLKFASLADFNNSVLQLEYFPYSEDYSFSIMYSLEYYGTFKQPIVSCLNQSINFKFSL